MCKLKSKRYLTSIGNVRNCLVLKRKNFGSAGMCKLMACTIENAMNEWKDKREREWKRVKRNYGWKKKKLSNTYHTIFWWLARLDLLLVFHWFHVWTFIHSLAYHLVNTHAHTCIHRANYSNYAISDTKTTIVQRQCAEKKPSKLNLPKPISAQNKYTALYLDCFQRHM